MTSKSSIDEVELQMGETHLIGISSQRIKRNLSSLNILGVALNVANSWVGIAASYAFAVAAGGTATLLYTILLVSFTFLCTGASMAELASVYPTAGGQYHFTSILSPERYNKVISYSCGLTAVFAWIALTASITVAAAQLVLAVIIQYNPTYEPHLWHYFMVYQALGSLILVLNLFATKRMPWISDIGFFLTVSLFFVITITCAIRASPHASSREVWTDFSNVSGWPDGICFLTSATSAQWMFGGIDASLHLAEECLNAAKVVPKAIMTTVGIGSVTGFTFAISMAYSSINQEGILSTRTGVPIYALWGQATRSQTAATIFISFYIAVVLFAMNAVQQTASRLTWAFACDNGILWSKYVGIIHHRLEVPVWAYLLNFGLVFLIGILYLVSVSAFNAVIGTATILQQISIATPMVLLICHRRSVKFLPADRYFKMPLLLGYIANGVCIIWTCIITIFFMFPTALPVTGLTMNYAVVVITVMALLGVFNWFAHARKQYQGPRLES